MAGTLIGTLGVELKAIIKPFLRSMKDGRDAVRGFGKGAKAAGGDVDTLTKSLKGMGKSLGLAAAGYAAMGAAQKAFDMAKVSAQFTDAKKIFDRAGASIDDLRDATRGMVDDATLVKKTNLARTMGINADQVAKFAQIAEASSRSTGQSMEHMFDSIILGSARQSKMILDNLGIIISVEKENENYAKSLGKTASALTDTEKKQAFLNAVMREGDSVINAAGNAAESNAAGYFRMETAVSNLALAFGQTLGPQVLNVSGWLTDLANDWIAFLKIIGDDKLQGKLDNETKLIADFTNKRNMALANSNIILAEEYDRFIAEANARFKKLTGGIIGGGVTGIPKGGAGATGPDKVAGNLFRDEVTEAFTAAQDLNLSMAVLGEGFGMLARTQALSNPERVLSVDLARQGAEANAVSLKAQKSMNNELLFLNNTLESHGPVMSNITKTTKQWAEEMEVAKRETAALARKQAAAGLVMVDIARAAMQGGGFSAAGSAVGGAVGTTVGGMLGPAGGAIGGAIGALIGGVLGNLIDELVEVLGILTPVFDSFAVVIRALSPIFIVFGILLNELSDTIELLAPLLLSFAEPVAGLLLIFVRLLTIVLHFENVLIRLATIVSTVIGGVFSLFFEAIDFVMRSLVMVALKFENVVAIWHNQVITVTRVLLGAIVDWVSTLPGMASFKDAYDPSNFGVIIDLADVEDISNPFNEFASHIDDLRNLGEDQNEATNNNTAATDANTSALQDQALNLRPGFKLSKAQFNATRVERNTGTDQFGRVRQQSREGAGWGGALGYYNASLNGG